MHSSITERLREEIETSQEESEALADAVIDALASPIDLSDLVDRVSRRTNLARGKALELCEMVCPLLSEDLDAATLAELRIGLPTDVLALFQRTPRPSPGSPPPHHPERRDQTLATGRPGSLHPLSEAAPGHRESVAQSGRPHDETKLSSSQGTSTEREQDTLATGRPGSRRPLSESED